MTCFSIGHFVMSRSIDFQHGARQSASCVKRAPAGCDAGCFAGGGDAVRHERRRRRFHPAARHQGRPTASHRRPHQTRDHQVRETWGGRVKVNQTDVRTSSRASCTRSGVAEGVRFRGRFGFGRESGCGGGLVWEASGVVIKLYTSPAAQNLGRGTHQYSDWDF